MSPGIPAGRDGSITSRWHPDWISAPPAFPQYPQSPASGTGPLWTCVSHQTNGTKVVAVGCSTSCRRCGSGHRPLPSPRAKRSQLGFPTRNFATLDSSLPVQNGINFSPAVSVFKYCGPLPANFTRTLYLSGLRLSTNSLDFGQK